MPYNNSSYGNNRDSRRSYSQGRSQSYGGYQNTPAAPALPEFKFYSGDAANGKKGSVNPALFSDTAKCIAECFGTKSSGVTSTQFRRIFDEVKRFERLVETEEDWKRQEAYVRMISSKVAYAVARAKATGKPDSNGYWDNFKNFIDKGLAQVHDGSDFKVFVALFEAAYGFYYEIKPKDSRS